jgi:hypothetical protein
MKPSTVKLTRYIRPKQEDGLNPTQGVTLQVELDYSRRQIYVRYAICNHEHGEQTFNKRTGNFVASERMPVILPMWDGPARLEHTDLTEYVVAGLNVVEHIGVTRNDLRHINKMYMKAGPRELRAN